MAGGVSTSCSSRISPTISSRMSSSVINPDVPPNSSTTIARCDGPRWKSRNWLSRVFVSGTYNAGRTRSCQRTVAPATPSTSGTRSFAYTMPTRLSGVPSYTGRRECSLWWNVSRTSSAVAATSTAIMSSRGVITSSTVVSARVKTPSSMWRCHEGVQALVHAAEQPQERSEGREGAPRQRQGLGGELRRDGGEGARRGIADHEQQRRGDRQVGETVEPGALPPAQQKRGRHGAEHEQRQARDVQRAVRR